MSVWNQFWGCEWKAAEYGSLPKLGRGQAHLNLIDSIHQEPECGWSSSAGVVSTVET